MSATPSPRSKFVSLHTVDTYNFWTVLFVSGGILVLYSLSRIIALQRRVRDLEARPPVDDIVMRGIIRQQVSEMVTDLEKSLKSKTIKNENVKPKEVVQEKKLKEEIEEVVLKQQEVKPQKDVLNSHEENETVNEDYSVSTEKPYEKIEHVEVEVVKPKRRVKKLIGQEK